MPLAKIHVLEGRYDQSWPRSRYTPLDTNIAFKSR
jgi:hypothetical protein